MSNGERFHYSNETVVTDTEIKMTTLFSLVLRDWRGFELKMYVDGNIIKQSL